MNDDDGNLLSETDNRLSGISVGYQYTPEGQTSSETLSSGGTAVNSQDYTYDQNSGLMTNATVSNGAVPSTANSATFNYTYIDGNSEIGSITTTLPGGAAGPTTTYSYDSDTGWLNSITTTNPGGATLYSINYTRDDDGRILTATTGGAATITYTYDPTTGQLATATPAGGSTTTYSFDASGNLTNLYGGPNNLDEYNNFNYNSNGDLTDDGTNTYAYDGLDRLISVTPDLPAVGSVMTTFDYNEENYRTAKTDFTWSGSAWVQSQELKYTYDASGNLEAEFNVTFNGGTETDTLLQTYGWSSDGSTLLSITMYNANGSVSGTYLPVTDGNNNVTALINAATGTVAATYTYDAFGNVLAYTGGTVATANPFRFDSCYFDSETGLYYSLNRYYSPSQGRFITRDPSGTSGGLNLYAYCQNDPVNNVDPSGLKERLPGFAPTALQICAKDGTDPHQRELAQQALDLDKLLDEQLNAGNIHEADLTGAKLVQVLKQIPWHPWGVANAWEWVQMGAPDPRLQSKARRTFLPPYFRYFLDHMPHPSPADSAKVKQIENLDDQIEGLLNSGNSTRADDLADKEKELLQQITVNEVHDQTAWDVFQFYADKMPSTVSDANGAYIAYFRQNTTYLRSYGPNTIIVDGTTVRPIYPAGAVALGHAVEPYYIGIVAVDTAAVTAGTAVEAAPVVAGVAIENGPSAGQLAIGFAQGLTGTPVVCATPLQSLGYVAGKIARAFF